MKILGVIPARYASSRFPGKPLVDILGKTMIRRVWEQAEKASSLSRVVVATDDKRIFQEVKSFGGEVLMTRDDHLNGTSRLIEVAEKLEPYDAYLNIQGDEPYISPGQIDLLCSIFKEREGLFAGTLVKPIIDLKDLSNPNVIKVTRQKDGRALYFSRSQIPFMRDPQALESWHSTHGFFRHIGIYGFSHAALNSIKLLPPGGLEMAESLEQLRWMENGIPIFTQTSDEQSLSVDSPEDLAKIIQLHKKNPNS